MVLNTSSKKTESDSQNFIEKLTQIITKYKIPKNGAAELTTLFQELINTNQKEILKGLSDIKQQMKNNTLYSANTQKPTVPTTSVCSMPSKNTNEKTSDNLNSQFVSLMYPIKETENLQVEEVKSCLEDNRKNLKIIRVHNVKKGGVLIETSSQATLNEANKIISEKLKPKIRLVSKKSRNPQFIIKNIPENPPTNQLIDDLINLNDINIPKESIKEITKINLKNNYIHWVLEVPSAYSKPLLKLTKVYLGFSRLNIFENFHITKCSNCHELGHSSKFCKKLGKQICAKCGDAHQTNSCEKEYNCWFCQENNSHRANSFICPNYMKRLENLKLVTKYE